MMIPTIMMTIMMIMMKLRKRKRKRRKRLKVLNQNRKKVKRQKYHRGKKNEKREENKPYENVALALKAIWKFLTYYQFRKAQRQQCVALSNYNAKILMILYRYISSLVQERIQYITKINTYIIYNL